MRANVRWSLRKFSQGTDFSRRRFGTGSQPSRDPLRPLVRAKVPLVPDKLPPSPIAPKLPAPSREGLFGMAVIVPRGPGVGERHGD
jgi:hypothetical protein